MLGPAILAGASTFDHDVAFVVKPFIGIRLFGFTRWRA
jgi:hypothetical protein